MPPDDISAITNVNARPSVFEGYPIGHILSQQGILGLSRRDAAIQAFDKLPKLVDLDHSPARSSELVISGSQTGPIAINGTIRR